MLEMHVSLSEWEEGMAECEERILAMNGAGLSDDELQYEAADLNRQNIEWLAIKMNAGVIRIAGNTVNCLHT